MYAILCIICFILYGCCWIFPKKTKYVMMVVNIILAIALWVMFPNGIIGHIITVIAVILTPLFTIWLGPASDIIWDESARKKK